LTCHFNISTIAAGNRYPLASHPLGVYRGEENRDARDVLRLAESPERSVRHHLLIELAADDSRLMNAFGLHDARGD